MSRRAAGQSLVLLALMLPVLLALTLGALEIGARLWQRAEAEDALRQANRAAVQTWLYPALADASVTVRPVEMIDSGRRYLATNLGSVGGLAGAPEAVADLAAWTPVVDPGGGTCALPDGTTLDLPRPGMCASLRVPLRGLLGWGGWSATISVADTLDVLQ